MEENNSQHTYIVGEARWVREEDRVNHWHCSNCGEVWGITAAYMSHCPNCGYVMLNNSTIINAIFNGGE